MLSPEEKKPNVQWHQHVDEIDFSLQRNRYHPKLPVEGFTVLNGVDIEKLFGNMTEADATMFRRKLPNPLFSRQTIITILDFWRDNQKLIPPTIVIFDQEYLDIVYPTGIPSEEFKPIDGKHRLRVAYDLGVKSLPILILKNQVALIKEKLGM